MSTPSRSDPEPRPWATWLLGALLLGFHGVTSLWAPQVGLPASEALLRARLRWFRQLIGGQHRRFLDAGEWERLLTSVWVHADLLHLGLNTLAIVVVGSLLERFVGPARVLTGFVVCGVLASLASYLLGPNVSDGASGAAFGLLGMTIAHGFVHRASLDPHDRSVVLRWLPGFVVLNLVLSVVLPFVDIVAHAGGLVAGLLLGLLPTTRGRAAWLEASLVVVVVIAAFLR